MNRDLEARLDRLERETGVCLCRLPVVSVSVVLTEEDRAKEAPKPAESTACPVHPLLSRDRVNVNIELDDEPTGVLPVADAAPAVANAIEPAPASQTVAVGSDYQPEPPRASPHAAGPLAAALGPAEAAAFKRELRLGLADMALRGVGIDPDDPFHAPPLSEQPDCLNCGHPSRVHSGQLAHRPCMAAMIIGPLEVHGPCQCRAYERSR